MGCPAHWAGQCPRPPAAADHSHLSSTPAAMQVTQPVSAAGSEELAWPSLPRSVLRHTAQHAPQAGTPTLLLLLLLLRRLARRLLELLQLCQGARPFHLEAQARHVSQVLGIGSSQLRVVSQLGCQRLRTRCGARRHRRRRWRVGIGRHGAPWVEQRRSGAVRGRVRVGRHRAAAAAWHARVGRPRGPWGLQRIVARLLTQHRMHASRLAQVAVRAVRPQAARRRVWRVLWIQLSQPPWPPAHTPGSSMLGPWVPSCTLEACSNARGVALQARPGLADAGWERALHFMRTWPLQTQAGQPCA